MRRMSGEIVDGEIVNGEIVEGAKSAEDGNSPIRILVSGCVRSQAGQRVARVASSISRVRFAVSSREQRSGIGGCSG